MSRVREEVCLLDLGLCCCSRLGLVFPPFLTIFFSSGAIKPRKTSAELKAS